MNTSSRWIDGALKLAEKLGRDIHRPHNRTHHKPKFLAINAYASVNSVRSRMAKEAINAYGAKSALRAYKSRGALVARYAKNARFAKKAYNALRAKYAHSALFAYKAGRALYAKHRLTFPRTTPQTNRAEIIYETVQPKIQQYDA